MAVVGLAAGRGGAVVLGQLESAGLEAAVVGLAVRKDAAVVLEQLQSVGLVTA